jgi:hypothetical protein
MKTRMLLAFALAVVAAVFMVASHQVPAQNIPPTNPLLTINTGSVNLTTAQMVDTSTVRAFVPTGSKSGNCLTSLHEINTNFFPTGITVFCAEREPSAFGGVPGVLVSVFLPQPAPPDFAMSVTLYQQGAKSYGTPVLCAGADGC